MREFAKAAVLAAAIMLGALSPAFSQATNAPPPVINRGVPITPLGGYVIGSIARAAVSPMIATVILGRELTISGWARWAGFWLTPCFHRLSRSPIRGSRHRRGSQNGRRAEGTSIFHPPVRQDSSPMKSC